MASAVHLKQLSVFINGVITSPSLLVTCHQHLCDKRTNFNLVCKLRPFMHVANMCVQANVPANEDVTIPVIWVVYLNFFVFS